MKGNFPACLKLTEAAEGGNDDDPQDPGGRTSRGITQREYDAWQHLHNATQGDVWKAPQAAIDAIYEHSYWNPYCDLLPLGVDYMYFDTAVNEGPGKSVLFLQRALGITADGHFGVVTAAHVKTLATDLVATDKLISAFADERRADYRSDSPRLFKCFGAGWLARVVKCKAASLEMAHGVQSTSNVVA